MFRPDSQSFVPDSNTQQDGFFKTIGKSLVRPLQEGAKMADLVGGATIGQDFLKDPNYWQNTPDVIKKAGLRYSPEELQSKFGGDNTGDRLKNTLTTSLKTSAGVGQYFTPLGPGGKSVSTIVPNIMEKVFPTAVRRILTVGTQTGVSGALEEISRDSATLGSVGKSALSSFVFGSALRGGGEALSSVAGNIEKKIPRKLIEGYIKPTSSALQLKETKQAIDFGKKMLSEEIIDRGDLTTSPIKLYTINKVKLTETGNKIGEVAKNSNVKIPLSDIIKELDDRVVGMSEFAKSLPAEQQQAYKNLLDRSISGELTTLKQNLELLADSNKELSGWAVHNLKSDLDKTLSKAYNQAKTGVELSPQDALSMDFADVLREVESNNIPGIKELNKDYGYYKTVARASLPVISKQLHNTPLGDIMLVGMSGMFGASVAPGDLLTKLAVGTATGVTGAIMAKMIRNPSVWFTLATLLNATGNIGQGTVQAGMSKGPEFVGRTLFNALGQKEQ